jgi:hypothetical protein
MSERALVIKPRGTRIHRIGARTSAMAVVMRRRTAAIHEVGRTDERDGGGHEAEDRSHP